ncbi:hypothetical protein IJ384_00755 [bacterium]|nr:hypothetical protein [bacterium]
MTFQVNGSSGIYDKKVADESIRYGKNAVDNHIKNMEAPLRNDNFATPPVFNFSPSPEAQEENLKLLEKYIDKNDEYLKSLPPLEYEYRYMPNIVNGNIDKKAVLGAALEEMNGVKEMPVEQFENLYLIDDSQTAKPLDINKDGKIDVSEYSANIIATDILSKGTTDPMKADGVINSKGMNAILEYSKKSNAEAASKLYASVYNTHKLGDILNQI